VDPAGGGSAGSPSPTTSRRGRGGLEGMTAACHVTCTREDRSDSHLLPHRVVRALRRASTPGQAVGVDAPSAPRPFFHLSWRAPRTMRARSWGMGVINVPFAIPTSRASRTLIRMRTPASAGSARCRVNIPHAFAVAPSSPDGLGGGARSEGRLSPGSHRAGLRLVTPERKDPAILGTTAALPRAVTRWTPAPR